jgi:PAS domain S-box-containing protein
VKKPDSQTRDLQRRISALEKENAQLHSAHVQQLRILGSLETVNSIIIGTDNLEKILDRVLQEFLKIFSCDRAWLLYPCDPDAASFRVPMERTVPQWPGAETEGIDIPHNDFSQGAMRQALETPGAVRFDPEKNALDPDEEINNIFHIRSQLVVAIRPMVGKPWLLGIHHCEAPVTYNKNDCDLFEALGSRLADGLSSMLAWRNTKRLFENAEISIWNEDLSEVSNALEEMRGEGVKDLRQYLQDNKQVAWDLAAMIKVINVNEATLALFGAKSEDDFLYVIDKTFGPDAIEVFIDELCAIWDKQNVFRSEAKYQSLDGREISAIISFRIPLTAEGFQSVPVSIIDITERKQAEEALGNAHAQLESRVLERTRELNFQKFALDEHAIVSITDVRGKIIYANPKFCEISEYSFEELEGKNHRLIKSDEHPPEFYADMWKTISSGKVWQGEIKNLKKNGGHYWVMSTIVPSLNEKEVPFQYISIRTDITERKDAEIKAMTASRTKSELMANMSHELRTPLNAIIGFSGSIKEETFGPLGNEKYREYLEDIHQSGQHLLDLINDILDVSAVEAGALELQEENVIIADVAEAAAHIIRPRTEQGKVTISSKIDPELPLIYADVRRIKQVLLNLLSNAVKFTSEGGEVALSAWSNDDGSLAISVADTGIGMNEKELAMALSTFGQVDSGLNRKHEGTGLGLPLTKGLMELHGGTLEVKSEKDKGTLVTVIFPKERVVR